MCDHTLCIQTIQPDTSKIIINLDDISNKKLVKKVLCMFTDEDAIPISLSKNTTVRFHTLVELHAGHSFHHYNYHLGKKKHFFTDKKQEEEGLRKSEHIWILDFGWTLHEDNIHSHSNNMEFSFHFDVPHGIITPVIDKHPMIMHMYVLYEDTDYSDFEFGWLMSKLQTMDKKDPFASRLLY